MEQKITHVLPLGALEALFQPVLDKGIPNPAYMARVQAKAENESTYNLNGFTVTDKTVVIKALETEKKRYDLRRTQYLNQRDELKNTLASAGITAKAYLPLPAWKAVLDRFNLKVFEPGSNGEIAIKTGFATQIVERLKNIFGYTAFAAAFVSYIAVAKTLGWDWWRPDGYIAFSIWFGLAASCILSTGIGLWLAGALDGYFAKKKWEQASPDGKYEMLFGSHPNNWKSHADVKISFPVPPPDVVTLLVKLKDSNTSFKVAAEWDAVTFNPSIEKVISRVQQENRAYEIRRDPIIYMELGSVVAVLDQYGDSPFEKAAIAEIFDNHLAPL